MSFSRVLGLSVCLIAGAGACSAPPAAPGDPDLPAQATQPPGDGPPDDGQVSADAGAGATATPQATDAGTGDVTKKTDGEPEIVSWGWLGVTPNNFFPTYLSANLAEIGHLTRDIKIKNPSDTKKRFILRAALQGFTKTETPVTIDLAPGETKSFWADSALDYDALSKLSSATDSAITVTLSTTEGALFYSVNAYIKVLPKNQVFWKNLFNNTDLGGTAKPGTMEQIAVVGAMTTPHDRDGYVDKLLQQAAQLTKGKYLAGYQGMNANTTVEQASDIVNEQAAAIYAALHNEGMIYTDVAQDFFDTIAGQNVRFPAESLRAKTTNCIDGTLVFASAFEALGMVPIVYFVPGHAFVGVMLGPAGTEPGKRVVVIETTVVATKTYKEATDIGSNHINNKYKGKWTGIPLSVVRNTYKFLPFPM